MSDLQLLLLTAVSVSFLHTLAGPDHYMPFVALAKARGWSVTRTLFWTLTCGFGHVGSSVLLGLGGAALGWSVSKISWAEQLRGGLAGWTFFGFGFVYCLWGLVRAKQNKQHKHFDVNDDGSVYVFEHRHGEAVAPKERHAVTPWVMFIVFVLGPCEPMIPLLYFPAAKHSAGNMLLLVVVYTLFTLITMVTMVVLGFYGIHLLKTEKIEKYMHALGGFAILICGAGMVFLNW